MPYVTSVERQGIKKGALLSFQEAVMDVLEARFTDIPQSVKNAIKRIDDQDLLKILLGKAVVTGSLKEFREILINTEVKGNA